MCAWDVFSFQDDKLWHLGIISIWQICLQVAYYYGVFLALSDVCDSADAPAINIWRSIEFRDVLLEDF